VVVWFAILRWYGLGFASCKPNLSFNSLVMMLTPNLHSTKYFQQFFLPIWIRIITIWWSLPIIPLVVSMVVGNVVGFFVDYNLTFKYCFKLKLAWKVAPMWVPWLRNVQMSCHIKWKELKIIKRMFVILFETCGQTIYIGTMKYVNISHNKTLCMFYWNSYFIWHFLFGTTNFKNLSYFRTSNYKE